MYFILDEVNKHPLLTAIIAMITGSITALTLKSFRRAFQATLKFLLGIFITERVLADNYSSNIIALYLNKKAKPLTKNAAVFDARNQYVVSEEDERVVWYKVLHGSFNLFWYLGALVNFMPERPTKKNTLPIKSSIRYLRGTVNFEKLLSDASTFKIEYDKLQATAREFRVIRHKGEHRGLTAGMFKNDQPEKPPEDLPKYSMLDEPVNYTFGDLAEEGVMDPLGQLALTDEMQAVIKDIKFWFSRRKWYRDRGITWRRGVLLFGSPGVGKTSITRAIAQELDLPIHIFDLASMDNSDLIEAWEKTQGDGARICLLEDIDSIFHGRENIMDGSQLSFDTLLNLVDGVVKEDGLLLIVTTNRIEAIDPALGTRGPDGRSTRPGRIDMIAELKGLDHKGRVKIGMRILRDDLVAEKLAIDGSEDTAAQFVERCVQFALKDLWGT